MESGHIVAEVTREPVPRFPSWPALKEEGRGVALQCNYIITHSDIEAQYNKLLELLKSISDGTAMELVL
ncbi:hypothetical protein DPMN_186841 [Dreissena polymorpha]|uniref:Uncharacterized protein n=1 Tax=Dreissena polymorpha TaxID=45954 RepID=A0A9D4DMW6_DREPO|nr:hypothetical protein DPMN_186841 [Dreissena polymorpha]